MKKQLTVIVLLAAFAGAVNAQKEGNIWHFGEGFALDFNSGAPVITAPSAMSTFEGCASIADADGNLLFYTNGGGRDPILSGQSSGKIWNRNHDVLYDMGNTEGGGLSAAQSSVIIPRPGAPGRYYLFTMEEIEFYIGGDVPGQPQGRGLSYFEIDMAQNGGLGGVVDYTPMILVPSYEGLCAVRHQNGSDYWIIVHNDNLGMSVFPVTAAGVGVPTLYNIIESGIIKGSPDGKWICSSNGIYPFDNQTGAISNAGLQYADISAYEFSPDGKRLFFYQSSNQQFGYFDLTAADIIGSSVAFEQLSLNIGQMQVAADGNIYFIELDFFSAPVALSVIRCPNGAPFLDRKVFVFNTSDFFLGLPNFDNAIFRRDGASETLNVDLGADLTLCENQVIRIGTGIGGGDYTWSNGAVTDTIEITAPGSYAVTVTAPGCAVGADTLLVSASPLVLNAGADQTACTGAQIALQAVTNGVFSWSPADLVADPAASATQFVGDTSAALTATAVLGDCILFDTLFINLLPAPLATVQPGDTTIEVGESVVLTGAGIGAYSWTPAAGLSCSDCPDPTATPDSTTTYQLLVVNSNGCADSVRVTVNVTPPDCSVFLPNAFTPNGDSVNDSFQLPGKNVELRSLAVYNRWGQEVYRGNSPWDGRIADLDAPSDVYVYAAEILVCGEYKKQSGEITLIR